MNSEFVVFRIVTSQGWGMKTVWFFPQFFSKNWAEPW